MTKKHSVISEEILRNCASPMLVHGVVLPCGKCNWCLTRIRCESRVVRKPPKNLEHSANAL